jgi:hypothetical protein
VTTTTFTTWVRWFRWNSLVEEAAMDGSDDAEDDEENKAERAWLAERVKDTTGELARALHNELHDGDPDGEGVIWPHIAEISLLGGLGCGGWLTRLILEELEQRETPYKYAIIQATENAVPFYESLGFVRVGAVARYDEFQEGNEDAPPAPGGGAGGESTAQKRERRKQEQELMRAVYDAINSARKGGLESGHSLAEIFRELPNKNELPEYVDEYLYTFSVAKYLH